MVPPILLGGRRGIGDGPREGRGRGDGQSAAQCVTLIVMAVTLAVLRAQENTKRKAKIITS